MLLNFLPALSRALAADRCNGDSLPRNGLIVELRSIEEKIRGVGAKNQCLKLPYNRLSNAVSA